MVELKMKLNFIFKIGERRKPFIMSYSGLSLALVLSAISLSSPLVAQQVSAADDLTAQEKTVLAGKSRRSHIIDPRTGEAIGGTVSVTVLLEDAETADALTKPFFMNPSCSAEDWAKWLARFPKASII